MSEKESERAGFEDMLYLPYSCRALIMHEYGLKRDTQSIRSRYKSTVSRSTLRESVVFCAAFKSLNNFTTRKISSQLIYRVEGACIWVWARWKTRFVGLLQKQRATEFSWEDKNQDHAVCFDHDQEQAIHRAAAATSRPSKPSKPINNQISSCCCRKNRKS